MPDQDVAAIEEQNMRDLKLIREEPAWALSMVQECRRLGKRVEALEAELRQMKARRDWQYDKAIGWRNRCVKAETELRHATDSLVRERLRYHEQKQRAEKAEAERAAARESEEEIERHSQALEAANADLRAERARLAGARAAVLAYADQCDKERRRPSTVQLRALLALNPEGELGVERDD